MGWHSRTLRTLNSCGVYGLGIEMKKPEAAMKTTSGGLGMGGLTPDRQDVFPNEPANLYLGHFSTELIFLDVAGEIRPLQPFLPIVVIQHHLQHLLGFSIGQSTIPFIGSGMNFPHRPDE